MRLRRLRELRRERRSRNHRLRRFIQRFALDAHRMRLVAGPRRQPEHDVAGTVRLDRHLPGRLFAPVRPPCAGHGSARQLQHRGRVPLRREPRGLAAELQPDGEPALSVMALRHVPEACLRPVVTIAAALHDCAVVRELRIGLAFRAADGAAVERQTVRRHRHRAVGAVFLDQRVVERQLRRAAPAPIRRAARRRAAEIDADRWRAAAHVHLHRLAEGDRHPYGLALRPAPVVARAAHPGRAVDGRRVDLDLLSARLNIDVHRVVCGALVQAVADLEGERRHIGPRRFLGRAVDQGSLVEFGSRYRGPGGDVRAVEKKLARGGRRHDLDRGKQVRVFIVVVEIRHRERILRALRGGDPPDRGCRRLVLWGPRAKSCVELVSEIHGIVGYPEARRTSSVG